MSEERQGVLLIGLCDPLDSLTAEQIAELNTGLRDLHRAELIPAEGGGWWLHSFSAGCRRRLRPDQSVVRAITTAMLLDAFPRAPLFPAN